MSNTLELDKLFGYNNQFTTEIMIQIFDDLHKNRTKNCDLNNLLVHNRYKLLPNNSRKIPHSIHPRPCPLTHPYGIKLFDGFCTVCRVVSSDKSYRYRSQRYRDAAVICLVNLQPVQSVEEDVPQLSSIQNMKQHSLVVMPSQETFRKTR